MSTTSRGDEQVVQATKSIGYNMILQVLMRLTTFALNALIIRHVDRTALGLINVRLMLLFSTVQFLSREPFRRAALSDSLGRRWDQVVTLLWSSVPLAALFGSFLGFIWYHYFEHPPPSLQHDYNWAIVFVIIAAVLENCAESQVIFGQLNGFLKLKVLIEGFQLLVRVIFMVILIPIFPHRSIAVFSVALAISSFLYSFWYSSYFHFLLKSDPTMDKGKFTHPVNGVTDFLPSVRNLKNYDSTLGLLSLTFLKQGLLKQFLTEGERYVMTVFSIISFAEQGTFDIINNLGSMAARLVFYPIEESSYLLFSQLIDRQQSADKQTPDKLAKSRDILENLLKIMVLISSTILVFGHNFSRLALLLYGGTSLATDLGVILLKANCVYIPFIAINGVTESFTFAAMSKQSLESFNRKMVGISIVFLVASIYLTQIFGSQGFIWGNCINMGLRIIHSLTFIGNYFGPGNNPLRGLVPNWSIIGFYAVAYYILRQSEARFCCGDLLGSGIHIAVGVVLILVLLILIYLKEVGVRDFVTKYISRNGKSDEKNE